MLLSRVLTTDDDLRCFAERYQTEAQGVGLQLEYLHRARVRVYYPPFRPHEFRAGHTVNAQPPLRYFVAPGETAKTLALREYHLRETDLVEIGAIWFARYDSPWRWLHRLQFYFGMTYDAWRTRQPYVLGGSFIAAVVEQQTKLLPQIIYKGTVRVGKVAGLLHIYVGPRAGLWKRFAAGISGDFLARQRKAWRAAPRPIRLPS
jgi:hypothetical protein